MPQKCLQGAQYCAKAILNRLTIPQRCRRNGFTLIEILIAILIVGLVMSTVYAAYSGSLKIVQEIEYENNVYNMARTALDRLMRDLTSITPAGGAWEIRADKESLENHEFGSLFFWSAAHLAFNENEVDGSATLIGYFVEEDAGGGAFSLHRSDIPHNKVIKAKSIQNSYVICRNVESLRFRFYDREGKEYDSWDSSSPREEQRRKAPAAVQIEIVFVNVHSKEKPFNFMTKIFLTAQE